MMKKQLLFFIALSATLFIASCGKNDDAPTPDPDPIQEEEMEEEMEEEPEVLIGVFKDAEVEGLSYSTPTQNGTTNAAGEFNYLAGEEVTFKVGDVTLGSATGQEVISPITLAQTIDPNATIETKLPQNIAALLQTLDADGDETNGITIAADVANNLGIQEIDFNQPIEAILADIILNVLEATGAQLEIVYPEEATNALANNFDIDFVAPENFSFNSFVPTIKAYLETWEQNYTLPTAVYKTTFDDMGNLVALAIISRYSGKIFHEFAFSSHLDDGLPTNGSWSNYFVNSLNGANPNNTVLTSDIAFTYNMDHQVETFDILFTNGGLRSEQFTAYDENNRPLAYFRDIAPDDPNRDFTISWDLTFDAEGRIATAVRTFLNISTIDSNNRFETLTTRDFTYSYDASGNLSSIDYSRIFDELVVTDGQEERFLTTAMVMERFSYDTSNKLTAFSAFEDVNREAGTSFTADINSAYNENERVVSYSYVSSDGFENNSTYEDGILMGSVSTLDGLPSRETTYNADGSREEIVYEYFDGVLYRTEESFYNSDFIIEDRVIRFYDQDGSVVEQYDLDYDADGNLTQETGTDANGEIFAVYYYDINGFIIRLDFYFEGELTSYVEYEYDAAGFRIKATDFSPDGELIGSRAFTYASNGLLDTIIYSDADGLVFLTEVYEFDENFFISKISGFGANGNLSFVLNYVDGILVSQEIYDEDGNLVEIIDFTGTGKIPTSSALSKNKNVDRKMLGDFDRIDNRQSRRQNLARKPQRSKRLDFDPIKASRQVSPKIQQIRLNR